MGTIGYLEAGVQRLSDAMYGAVTIYGMNLQDGYRYNIWLEIARWTGPLVTAVAILYVCRWVGTMIHWKFTCFAEDSVAVYCDDDTKITFDKQKHAVIYPKREFVSNAKSHIIMLETDEESLRFYEKNKNELKGKKVYIGLREISYGLVKDQKGISFFDIDGTISRKLWKEQIKLWEKPADRKVCSITICGTGHLGRNILNYALMLNLYSLEQQITYNFVGDNNIYQIEHRDFQMENNDQLNFYSAKSEGIDEMLKNSDIVILTREIPVEQLQVIGVLCNHGEIYYYDPAGEPQNGSTSRRNDESDTTGEAEEGGIAKYLEFKNLHPFGCNKTIFTDENIRKNKLILSAMEQNFNYLKSIKKIGQEDTKESKWEELDRFDKWSNISSSDYATVIRALRDKVRIEELAELEHIRWCRFHYLNHWKFGKCNEGNRDKQKKIHTCLRPYGELSLKEQKKDIQTVKDVLGKKKTI